jgi:hypothetical protein
MCSILHTPASWRRVKYFVFHIVAVYRRSPAVEARSVQQVCTGRHVARRSRSAVQWPTAYSLYYYLWLQITITISTINSTITITITILSIMYY